MRWSREAWARLIAAGEVGSVERPPHHNRRVLTPTSTHTASRPLGKLRCALCRRAGNIGEHLSPGVYTLFCEQHYDPGTEVVTHDWVPEWMRRAACLGRDPEHADHRTWVRLYCIRCPVWEQCLDLALRAESEPLHQAGSHPRTSTAGNGSARQGRHFVYGGLSATERIQHPEPADAREYAARKLFDIAMEVSTHDRP